MSAGGGETHSQSSSSPWTSGSDWIIEITNDDDGKKEIYNVHRDRLIHGKVTSGYFQRLFESATFASEHQDCTSRITLPSSGQAEAFPIFLDFLYEKEKVEVKNNFYYVYLSQLGDYFEIQGLEKGSFVKQGCLSFWAHVKATSDVTTAISFCNRVVSTISDKDSGDRKDIACLVALMLSHGFINRTNLHQKIRVPTSLLAVALPLVQLKSTDLLGSFEIVVQYVKRCLRKNTDKIPTDFFSTAFESMFKPLKDVSITPRKADKLKYAKKVITVCLAYLDLDCQYSPIDQKASLSCSQSKIIRIIRSFQDRRKTMIAKLHEIYSGHKYSSSNCKLASLTRHCPSFVMLELLE